MESRDSASLRTLGVFGEDICISIEKLSKKNEEIVRGFSCGNDEIDEFFRNKALHSINEVTYLFIDDDRKCLAAAASLACSSIPVSSAGRCCASIPCVEITYFAVNTAYQRLYTSADPDDLYFSDSVLCSVIRIIHDISDNYCGASHILLYSTEAGKNLYERQGFVEIPEGNYIIRDGSYTEGCTPMMFPL